MKSFDPGRIIVTTNALDTLGDELDFIRQCLKRHLACDWGEVCDGDKAINNQALDSQYPGRLMSVYTSPKGIKIWIITEWDRSVTTVLLPEDY